MPCAYFGTSLSSWQTKNTMEWCGIISFRRTATTESVARKLSELPKVCARSKINCASCRAETMDARKEVERAWALSGKFENPAIGAVSRCGKDSDCSTF